MAVVQYRLAGEVDLTETVDVFFAAVADMYARNGIAAPLPNREAVETGYRHVMRTGIFHVAEVDGQIGAICHAVVRDQLWFLSGFWTLPRLQGRKIGGTLLERVRAEGERAGASTFFTWSSVDLAAMALYMKMGMLPGYQVLSFAGPVRDLPEERFGYKIEPLQLSAAVALDGQVRATGREMDHSFWLFVSGHAGRQALRRDGQVVGYYYLHHGAIGPAAWANSVDAEALMEMACREAAGQAEQVRMMIPGANHAAIRFALRTGLRLASFSHLLTTSPFGRLEQYLTSGPLLF